VSIYLSPMPLSVPEPVSGLSCARVSETPRVYRSLEKLRGSLLGVFKDVAPDPIPASSFALDINGAALEQA
jgi:hypothetical protein